MKRILAFILIAVLLLAVPVVVSAEAAEENGTVTENLPTENESATETEISDTESITEQIVDYVKSHLEEISVMLALIGATFLKLKTERRLNGSISTVNNNAVSISENSVKSIAAMLDEAKDIAVVVQTYKDEFATLIAEVRKSDEEKQTLEQTLNHVETFLKTAKLATLELSNEVAELLVLANIPNSKKEELYARHTNAVRELKAVEAAVEEVMSNDSKET